MIKAREQTDPNSCLAKARQDEMIFVLLGRDTAAATTVRFWAAERVRLGKNKADDPQIVEAMRCAEAMGGGEDGRLRIEVEAAAFLEAGVYGRGKPTDVYPDWVYEARDAIRRQTEDPPPWLADLLAALGWQGGTIHAALKAVQRLVAADKERRP